jgi:succinoglycan biosynthesis transport protein ExoP
MESRQLLHDKRIGLLLNAPRLRRPASFRSNPDFEFDDLWRILQKRKWTVIHSVLILLALALAASLYMTPKYEAVSTIEVNKSNSDLFGLDAKAGTAGASTDSLEYNIDLQTEASLLQSDSLALQVTQELGLEKRKEFALTPGVFYGSTLTEELKRPLDKAPMRQAKIRKVFEKNLKTKTISGTRMLEIHFLSPDPQTAVDVVNTLVNDYLERHFRTRYAANELTSVWLSQQLSELKSQVEDSQQRLNTLQKEAGILGTDESNNVVTVKLAELNKQLTAAEANRILKETVYRLSKSGNPELISSVAGSSLIEGSSGTTNPNLLSLIQSLRMQEAELKAQYAQAAAKYGSAYPRLVQLRNQLKDLENSIQSENQKLAARAENDYLAARDAEKMLRASFDRQKAEATQLNDRAVQYTVAKREVESGRTLYENLLTKLKEADVLSTLRSTNIAVVDPARVAADPTRPSYLLNLSVGFGLGLLGGLGLAFLREGLDHSVSTPEQLEAIASLPSFGIVPEAPGVARQRLLGRKSPNTHWSILEHPVSEMAEAYRALRTQIMLSNLDAPPKVIMITSALPQEGKTTTSVNTAIALAQQGRKVLLVDADLRQADLHRYLNMDSASGLSESLVDSSVAMVTHPEIPNLSVLVAGATTICSAELLGSDRMSELVAWARNQFEFIIIDTPPVLLFTDAVVISHYADAVLLVVRAGKTAKQSLLRARDLLLDANANIAGVVVNRVKISSPDYYRYYGYYGSEYGRRYSNAVQN